MMENTREAFDKLRWEIASGKITCDTMIQRLTVAIEAEYLKEKPNIDFINTCEDFLWELGTQGQQQYISPTQDYVQAIKQASYVKNGRSLSWNLGKRFAVIAAVFLLVLGLSQGTVSMRWVTRDSDQDGEIYVIQGHEITVELIQSVLAEHEHYTSLQTRDWDELCEFLGFVPCVITPEMLQASSVEYVAHVDPGIIVLDVQYEAGDKSTIAILKHEYYAVAEEAYLTLQQNSQGTYVAINNQKVYISENIEWSSFTWFNDFIVTTLSGDFTAEQGMGMVEQLIRRQLNE